MAWKMVARKGSFILNFKIEFFPKVSAFSNLRLLKIQNGSAR